MNPSELRIADMHTVLNILNILCGELALLRPDEPKLRERCVAQENELQQTARELKEGGEVSAFIPEIRKSEDRVIRLVEEVLEAEKDADEQAAIQESLANLKSVFSVFNVRLDELEIRAKDPDIWILVEPAVFRKRFEDVFTAIARNSKGSYEIRFDPAEKEEGDYFFDLNVKLLFSDEKLWLPLRMVDVLCDLGANARKYTPPGGAVSIELVQDEDHITVVVEDSGSGIPGEEIEKVAEFGYRGSNVRRRPTQGGGFGLTKAAWLATTWGGSLNIRSGIDRGTRIQLSIPNRERTANPKVLES